MQKVVSPDEFLDMVIKMRQAQKEPDMALERFIAERRVDEAIADLQKNYKEKLLYRHFIGRIL